MTAKTAPTASERCEIFLTTSGAVKSRCGVAALISFPRSAKVFPTQSLAGSRLSPADRGTSGVLRARSDPQARLPELRSDLAAMRGCRPRCPSGLAEELARHSRA